ncbi:RAMP superfamily CRISPR-associated protein [Sulfolobus tengchongensis]|uniref:RAMP superfamily CRISPR-associated protein n=1 Tax=Sulfolobus tengchongensis TaxID=207809 RepID=A0AAX4L376_9CREN
MQRSHIQRNEYTKRNSKGLDGVIELELTVKSNYLHVGSGKYDVELVKPISNIDELVNKALSGSLLDVQDYFSPLSFEMCNYNGKVVIPGSSIKGLVRSRLELSIPGSCFIISMKSNSSSQTYRRIFKPSPRQSDTFDPERFPAICPVCDLLGNTGLASRVSFSDFVMTSGKVDNVSIRGIIYECAVKDSKFLGRVVFRSLKPIEIGMLLYGFGLRIKGNSLVGKTLLLGRFKYSDRRFGRVVFSIVNPKGDYVKAVNDFVSKFNPLDFNEEW